jgi:hypothetical protein
MRKNVLKHIKGFIAGISTVIGFDSYRRLLSQSYIDQNTNELLQDTVRRSTEIADKLDEVLQKNKDNVQLETKLNQLKDNVFNLNQR